MKWYQGECKDYKIAEQNCNADYIRKELAKIFPQEEIAVTYAEVNKSGVFENPLGKLFPQYAAGFAVHDLPPFCDIRVERTVGAHKEKTYFWAPLQWNGRFCGTAGGGNKVGGLFQIMRQNNLNRGMNLATAIINGFAAANCDGAINDADKWGMDAHGNLDTVLIDEWAHVATHKMTEIGKALCFVLYGENPKFSYLHGGSGGGRQSLMEAEHYPNDYDGIWASCPANGWSKLFIAAIWSIAVMNEHNCILPPDKLETFAQAVYKSCGGEEKYFASIAPVDFDAFGALGQDTDSGKITEQDCVVMNEIWQGMRSADGTQLYPYFRSGVRFWSVGIGATALNYIQNESGKSEWVPFFVANDYISWIMRSRNVDYGKIGKAELFNLMDKSVKEFSYADADTADLRAFFSHGGKLLLDHGTGDPLVIPDATWNYYEKVLRICGAAAKENSRLFFNAGDGHGNCFAFGAGIPESEGMQALIEWVESGKAIEKLNGIRADAATGKILEEKELYPV